MSTKWFSPLTLVDQINRVFYSSQKGEMFSPLNETKDKRRTFESPMVLNYLGKMSYLQLRVTSAKQTSSVTKNNRVNSSKPSTMA